MTNQELKQLVENVDWSIYNGVESYDFKIVGKVFFELIELEKTDSDYPQSIEHKIISAIGNDHRGSFYPAVLSALDILIKVVKSGSPQSSQSALTILDNLCASFTAEVGTYSNHSADEINRYFIDTLHSNRSYFQQRANEGNKLAESLVKEIELRLTSRSN